MWTYIYIWNIWRFIYRILIIWTSIQVCCRKVIQLIVFFFFNKCWVRVRFAIAENWFKPSNKPRWPYQDGYSTFLEEIILQIKYKNWTKSDNKKQLMPNVCYDLLFCVFHTVFVFVQAICHVSFKLDPVFFVCHILSFNVSSIYNELKKLSS